MSCQITSCCTVVLFKELIHFSERKGFLYEGGDLRPDIYNEYLLGTIKNNEPS